MPKPFASPFRLRRLFTTAVMAALPLTLISATENGQSPPFPAAAPERYNLPGYVAREAVSPSGTATPVRPGSALPVEQQLSELRAALQRNQAQLERAGQQLSWMGGFMQRLGQTLEWLEYRQQAQLQWEGRLRNQVAAEQQARQDSHQAGARITALQRERDQLRQRLAERDRRLARLTAEVRQLRENLQHARSESAQLRQQLDAATTTLASVAPAHGTRRPDPQVHPVPVEDDRDRDGVLDSADLCPDDAAPGPVSPLGCEPQQPIVLAGVKFEYDSEQFTPDSKPILDRVAEVLSPRDDLKLEVAGHTDAQGDPAYNVWLSKKRARSVMSYLVERGVNADNLTARGYGANQPIGDNDTWAGIQKNRRVELRRVR